MKKPGAPGPKRRPPPSGRRTLRRDPAEEAVPGGVSPEENLALRHDLHVHRIELEMQNEELRRTRDELEESRQKYFDLYDLAPMGYATLNREGLILEANLTLSNQLGVERGSLVRRPLSRFLAPASRDAYDSYLRRLFETGEQASLVVAVVTQPGLPIWVRIDATLRDSESPETRSCRVALTDVTERKRTEDAVRDSEEKFSALFHFSPVPMSITSDVDGIYRDVNRTFLNVSGYVREEVIGRTAAELSLFGTPGDSESLLAAARNAEGASGRRVVLRTKGGGLFDCLISSRLIRVGEKTYLLSSILDLAERKQR